MGFNFGAVAVAFIFFLIFVVVKWKAKNERFQGLRIASYGLPIAAIGLLFGAFAKIHAGILIVAVAFPFYFVGAVIHLKIMMGKFRPKTTQWDEN